MANTIDKIEIEALKFMEKNKKREQNTKEEMVSIILATIKSIERLFSSLTSVNIYNIPTIVGTEIKPIIEDQRNKMRQIINGIVNDNYQVGIETGEKFLKLTNEKEEVLNLNDVSNSETLLALLLYGERLIDSLNEDSLSLLNKDLTSIYISSRNNERYTGTSNTLNTILSGSIIKKYINGTFKNITTRAETIAQTETNRALNHGVMAAYLAARREIPNLKVKWVEVRDNRICRHCKERANGGDYGNGVYDINTVSPPPLHARCRCILVPFSDRW